MAETEKNVANSVVYFGPFQLDLVKIRLWRGAQEVKLTGKAFGVLRYLIEHPGHLVTKDELFTAVWPETVVSEATLASCIQEIRQALRDKAKAPRYIETVHRRGYRFIAPLSTTQPVPRSTFNVPSQEEVADSQEEEESQKSNGRNQESKREERKIEGETEIGKKADRTFLNGDGLRIGDDPIDEILSGPPLPKEGTQLPPLGKGAAPSAGGFATAGTIGNGADTPPLAIAVQPRRLRWWQGLLLVVVAALGGGIAAKWRLVLLLLASYFPPPGPAPVPLPLPDKPSIVVLPFVNLSGDSSQDYFSNGLTDDLINTLAQFPDLFVIAHDSAFFYKWPTIKEQDIARELGVRYVLKGSARRADGQVRLNVELVDATTGEYLWAERYDRPFTEIFALQNELVHKLATTLKMQLPLANRGFHIAKRTDNVEAYDYALRGMTHWMRASKKDNLLTREFFEKALTFDPRYAMAYSFIGLTYYMEWITKWSPDPPQALEQALEFGQKAVALEESFPGGHLLLALVYTQKAQIAHALSEVERVLTLQPDLADGYGVRAEVLLFAGRAQEALPSIQYAIRLNPHAPVAFFHILGAAYLNTDQYAESIVSLKRAIALSPFHPNLYPMQAFNYTAQWITQQSDDPETLEQAYDAAQNGITLNATSPFGHSTLGFVYLWQKHYDNAIAEFEKAVTLDERYVCGQMLLAGGLSQVGRVEEAVRVGERALSLKALPNDDRCLFAVADAFALAGRMEEATALYQRMLIGSPNVLGAHLGLVWMYSELGREAETQAEIAEVLRLNPKFSLEVYKQRVPIKDPATLERYIAALRKAGLK